MMRSFLSTETKSRKVAGIGMVSFSNMDKLGEKGQYDGRIIRRVEIKVCYTWKSRLKDLELLIHKDFWAKV